MNQESEKEETQKFVVLKEEMRERLQKKLADYESRLDSTKPMGPQLGIYYKRDILKRLLDSGSMGSDDMKAFMREKYKDLNMEDYENAFGVILDYALTGGKHVSGGTGLGN